MVDVDRQLDCDAVRGAAMERRTAVYVAHGITAFGLFGLAVLRFLGGNRIGALVTATLAVVVVAAASVVADRV